MKSQTAEDLEIRDSLFRVKRGLCAYVSYLAACEMNSAFSEYVLYEPILRILTARNFEVECEYICPGIQHAPRGDKKRLDFYAVGKNSSFALEVKWAKSKNANIDGDTEKLKAFRNSEANSHAFLCIFGRQSIVSEIEIEDVYREWGRGVYADLRKTRYGCRIFMLKDI